MSMLEEFEECLGQEEGLSARKYRAEVALFGQFLADMPAFRAELDDLADAYSVWLEFGAQLPEAEWQNHLWWVCWFVVRRREAAQNN